MAKTADDELANDIRDVTDEEVRFYETHGWVKLDSLITPTLAARLLSSAREIMDQFQAAPYTEGPRELDADMPYRRRHREQSAEWSATEHFYKSGAQTILFSDVQAEPLSSLGRCKIMARAGYRLINRSRLTDREIGVLSGGGTLYCKTSIGKGSGNESAYHQDFPASGADRTGDVQIWLALDEVTPEQGAMRFLDKSHQIGPLGEDRSAYHRESAFLVFDHYPKLRDLYDWSPPITYKPGDATAHSSLTIHGGPENSTGRTRWSYIMGYAAADIIRHDPASETDVSRFAGLRQVYP